MVERSLEEFDAKSFIRELTEQPGVYRMLDADAQVIYVGKAKNLKNRVSSYFAKNDHTPKTRVMVKQIAAIEVTVTNTEVEALLLENHYIKQLKPRYNVIFRDDKTYPYIHLSSHKFPKLGYHRGARKQGGDYFGPFPSGSAARQSLSMLQKLFKVRQCEDSVFQNRSRPCLQFQIKRCKAPCVGFVSEEEYAKDVQLTRLFYQGKSEEVLQSLQTQMDAASEALEFESAAIFRDQLASLRALTQKQVISGVMIDADAFSIKLNAGVLCAVVVTVRDGQVLGSETFFPKLKLDVSLEELFESFVLQFYLSGREAPKEVILSSEQVRANVLESAIEKVAERRIRVADNVRGDRLEWLKLAEKNADIALQNKLNSNASQMEKVTQVKEQLGLDELPLHMECFDISHTMGEGTVASCVVFKRGAPDKSSYRRFNINDVTPGDDYAAIEQAVYRRYARMVKSDENLPDLILIDGGKGQLKSALQALEQLSIQQPAIVSVAKGTERKLGMEQLFFPGQSIAKILPENSEALHLIQHIRDEAHRFAIAGHRGRRKKQRNTSWLESIPGVGPKKRQQLLKHFGGLKNIEQSTLNDLKKVKGIDTHLAEKIYNYLHE
ncbi:excinuclease ABC subunit UvrC [Pleionea litopenaei]|uniref:UvrABC system protein C n=1 Tax=Pleionea litopenaei TaxID=3070815 RepID=A0AA51X8G5_9GAMM|nr:excinuclease ABC subunit UvrC [Pleionea sp. HL-JVS1]WMS88075.1 excinuclease ABC subunit UvrC [Pleionea sp. HL-JVS1]